MGKKIEHNGVTLDISEVQENEEGRFIEVTSNTIQGIAVFALNEALGSNAELQDLLDLDEVFGTFVASGEDATIRVPISKIK